ncbi:MAG: hypothetical protein C0605_03590 [Hyphomicrobiales bacterium]|nr:MAG: hypothetical protein C0605_03590 [Hyphomicrobiales bacterium]
MKIHRLVAALALCAVLSAALLPHAAGAGPGPYDGKYRLNGSWDCRNVGVDGGAIRITGDHFEGVESSCQMTNPTTVRDMGAHLYDLMCSGEGETYSYRLMLMRADDGGLYLITKGGAVHWQKCP